MLKNALRIITVVLIVTLVACFPVRAAKYAGEAFTLGVGARGMALGGAVVAGPFDGTAAYWNPAGLVALDGRYVVAMHAETFGSLLNHDFISYVNARPRPNSSIKAFGFYLYYLGGGGIKITALNEFDRPYVVSEKSHGDYMLAASIAGSLSDKINFGISAKVIYRDLGTETGKGLTADFGLLYQIQPAISAGLMVTDFTTGFIRYSGETFGSGANTESIYPAVKPGIAIQHSYREFTGRFVTSADIRFERLKSAAQYWVGQLSADTHFGGEIDYRGMVFGRVGFDIGRFTAGGGIDIRNITVDFAYLHHSELDETFRVSAGYRF